MAEATLNPALQRKLKKVLGASLSVDELCALDALGDVYGTRNTLQARKELRGRVEERCLEDVADFLCAYDALLKTIGSVRADVAALRTSCNAIAQSQVSAQDKASALLEQAKTLQLKKEENEAKIQVVGAFLEEFTLSSQSLDALKEEPGPEFFRAVQEVKRINSCCKILLKSRDHQQIGFDIADQMTKRLSTVHNKMYKWIQAASDIFSQDSPNVGDLFRQCINELNDDTALLGYCMDEIAVQRGKAVRRMFIRALTYGGPNLTPRPIEVHAHDPLRYVSDMLAWLHQTVASEHELLYSLLSYTTSQENISVSANAKRTCQKALTKAFDELSGHFKLQYEQAFEVKPGALVIFRLANTVEFYHRTIVTHGNLMPANSSLAQVLLQCKQDTLQRFRTVISDFMAKIMNSPPLPPSDLSVPLVFRDVISLMEDLINTFNTALLTSNTDTSEISSALDTILDPFHKVLNTSASLSKLDLSTMSVYLLNCVSCIQLALAGSAHSELCTPQLEMVQSQIDAYLETLVHEESVKILFDCGLLQCVDEVVKLQKANRRRGLSSPSLGPAPTPVKSKFIPVYVQPTDGATTPALVQQLFDASSSPMKPAEGLTTENVAAAGSAPEKEQAADLGSGGPAEAVPRLCDYPGMDLESLHRVGRAFEQVLHDLAGAMLVPLCDRILHPQLRMRARRDIARQLIDSYASLYDAVAAPDSGHPNVALVFHYSPQQIMKTLAT
eukprot:TRINITY_DN169_c0_g1_i1.p1 TRINITY_DN169_c0_g1~~TRINITY_DN169_c0_g1_i1.p1  ORF type:complete len:729 (+),score=178.99 TRINITY_DN169_c0_g1_i1:3-2189(+)